MSIISTVPKGAAVEGINPNLLRNWYFVGGGTGRGVFPVNSRGSTSYGSGIFNIDGYKTWRATVDLVSTGIKICSTAANQVGTNYQIVANSNELLGKTITISGLVDGELIKNSATIPSSYSSTTIINASNTITLSMVASGEIRFELQVRITAGKVFSAVKLELGDQQTLAHQENGTWVLNEIPDYEEELVRCKTSAADPADTYANKVLSTNVSNPNLLRNWYFNHAVNSRDMHTQSLVSNLAYTLDGWLGTRIQFAYTDYSGYVAFYPNNSNYTTGYLRQWVDLDVVGKQVTMSALLYNGKLITKTVIPVAGQDMESDTIDSCKIWIRRQTAETRSEFFIWGTTLNQVVQIVAVKLELGDQQTLCHQENGVWVLNEIPDYETEYYRCITSDVDSTDTYAGQKVSNITVQCNSVGSSSLRYYNKLIQSTHKVLDSTFSNPAAQTSDITVTTYDGYLDFSNGFASGATTNITLVLGTSGPVLSTSTTAPS